MTVRLTNAGCTPDPSTVAAGPVTFSILNDGGDRVTEVEIVQQGRILGEKENLAPGMSANLTLELTAGSYTITCPGAATVDATLTVTAATGAPSSAASPGASRAALLAQATGGYAEYVRGQVDQLLEATKAFEAAVERGDVAKAKSLYGPARVFYADRDLGPDRAG